MSIIGCLNGLCSAKLNWRRCVLQVCNNNNKFVTSDQEVNGCQLHTVGIWVCFGRISAKNRHTLWGGLYDNEGQLWRFIEADSSNLCFFSRKQKWKGFIYLCRTKNILNVCLINSFFASLLLIYIAHIAAMSLPLAEIQHAMSRLQTIPKAVFK